MPDNVLKAAETGRSFQDHYTAADVGLSGARPFRVCNTHWDETGDDTWPGDDPEAPSYPSRFLEMFAKDIPPGRPVPIHSHDFHEFVFVRRTRGNIHVTPETREPLRRGDVIIMLPRAKHGFEPMAGLMKTDLFLQPQWLSDELRLLWREGGLIQALLAASLFELPSRESLWMLHLEENEMRACELELEAMRDEARAEHPSLALFSGCFLKLLSILNRRFRASGATVEAAFSREVWAVAEAVEEVVRKGDPLDVDRLARQVALSRRQLDRVFRAGTGSSVGAYYRSRRIQHAARMLTEPRLSIQEVAHHLNYADTAHFVRSFKAKMGLTPGNYRTHARNGEPPAHPATQDAKIDNPLRTC